MTNVNSLNMAKILGCTKFDESRTFYDVIIQNVNSLLGRTLYKYCDLSSLNYIGYSHRPTWHCVIELSRFCLRTFLFIVHFKGKSFLATSIKIFKGLKWSWVVFVLIITRHKLELETSTDNSTLFATIGFDHRRATSRIFIDFQF